MRFRFIAVFSLGLLTLSWTGCRPKAQVKQETSEEAVVSQQAEEPSLRGKEYKDVEGLVAIYFDLDSSSLRNDAREALRKNYETLRSQPTWEALVEGHADERGTTEYNLGLGQRRAASVRQYYISLGIPGSRVATISYGKEKPACDEHNEDCWAKNRRGETKARVNPEK